MPSFEEPTVMTFKHRLSRRLALVRVTATVAVLAVVASCDFLPDPSGLQVAQIVIVPGSTTVQPDQDYQFVGYGRTVVGDSVAVALVWSTTRGTISPSGRYVADSLEGDYEVRATLAQPEADATVSSGTSKVRVRRLAQLLVTPAAATLRTQGTQPFAAYGRLNGGDSVPVAVTWAATGGSISSAGLFNAGLTPGEYAVTATGKGFSTAATVTLTNIPVASLSVTPASATLSLGSTQQLSAVTKDSAGNTLTGRVVTWLSSNPAVATVSGSGLVTAVAAGSATITATSEGKNGTSAIMVQATLPAPPVPHAGYYVAPTGSAGNTGQINSPWSLAHALSHPAAVQPGDTIWLRGGTYAYAAYTSSLTGTATNPIILRQYPGERAIVDGYMVVNGGYTWFWGFEILNSHLSDPEIMAFNLQAPGVKLINCIIHDAAGNGPGVWAAAIGAELYGNLIYNNGRMGSAPGRHAHGIYLQNATGTKRIVDNILFNNYSHNVHAYSEAGGLNNFHFEGNASFNSGAYTTYGGREYLIGGSSPVQNLTFTRNYSYRPAGPNGVGAENTFGLYDDFTSPIGSQVTDNYLHGYINVNRWAGLVFTGNTVVLYTTWLRVPSSSDLPNFTWNNNTYRWVGDPPYSFVTVIAGVTQAHTFATWQTATGFDAASNFQQGSPTGQVVFVRPNQYEAKRGHVIVYNWSGAATAAVDLSKILSSGDQFEVREVQNYFGPPVASGTYGGGTVNFPMAPVTAPPPLGPQGFPALSTGTTFHAFVVLGK
jgi:uncharacterized protein YjdB